MGIYEDVTAPTTVSALGVGASTDPLSIGTDPMQMSDTALPDLTQGMYQRIWGAPTTTTRMADLAPNAKGGVWKGDAGAMDLPSGQASATARQVIQAAKGFLGTPYAWGQESRSGVDCSGLILRAFQAAGIKMPRVSAEQVRTGRRVAFNQVQAGDLLGWDNSTRNNGADHVALVLGRKGNRVQIIEAAKPGTRVRIRWVTAGEGAWGSRIL